MLPRLLPFVTCPASTALSEVFHRFMCLLCLPLLSAEFILQNDRSATLCSLDGGIQICSLWPLKLTEGRDAEACDFKRRASSS